MKKVVICLGPDDECIYGLGDTPEEAFKALEESVEEDIRPKDCNFYDAVEFAIETKLERKVAVVRK